MPKCRTPLGRNNRIFAWVWFARPTGLSRARLAPLARCHPLPLWERVAAEGGGVRGPLRARRKPLTRPPPLRSGVHPLPQGERVAPPSRRAMHIVALIIGFSFQQSMDI